MNEILQYAQPGVEYTNSELTSMESALLALRRRTDLHDLQLTPPVGFDWNKALIGRTLFILQYRAFRDDSVYMNSSNFLGDVLYAEHYTYVMDTQNRIAFKIERTKQ